MVRIFATVNFHEVFLIFVFLQVLCNYLHSFVNTLQTFDVVNADWKLVCLRVRGQYYLSIETYPVRPNSRKEVGFWKCNFKIVFLLWCILLQFLEHYNCLHLYVDSRSHCPAEGEHFSAASVIQQISANFQSNTHFPYICSLFLYNRVCNY